MRTTRAYLAEFGTAGSVLAGAAVLFVIGSAIVGFQGWPKIANQGVPVVTQVPGAPVAGSRVSRRLRAIAAPAPASRHVAPSRGAPTAAGNSPGTPGALDQSGSSGLGSSSAAGSRAAPVTSGQTTVSTATQPPITVTVPNRPVSRTLTRVVRAVDNVSKTVSGILHKIPSEGSVTVQKVVSVAP